MIFNPIVVVGEKMKKKFSMFVYMRFFVYLCSLKRYKDQHQAYYDRHF